MALPFWLHPLVFFIFIFTPLSSNLVIAHFNPLARSFLLHNPDESGMAQANRCFLWNLTPEASDCMPTGKRMSTSWSICLFFENSLIIPSKKAWNFNIVLGEQLMFFRYIAKITWSCRFILHNIGSIWKFLSKEETQLLVYLTGWASCMSYRVLIKTKIGPLYLNAMVKLPCILWATSTGQLDQPLLKTQGQSWPMLPVSTEGLPNLVYFWDYYYFICTCWE